MADTTRSHSARHRGKFARFRRAGGSSVRRNWLGEPVSGPQLQWATHTEFPTIVRLFELNCCAIPVTAAGGGSVFAACKSSCRSGFGDAGRRSRRSPRRWAVRNCTSFGLLPGGIHRDCCRPRGPAGYFLRSSRGVYPILTRRTAATYTVVGPTCCMGREIHWESTKAVYCPPLAPRKKNTRVKSPSGEGTGCEKAANASNTKRERGPTSDASVPSRIPGNGAVSYGRFRWQTGRPRSQWSCSHPDPLLFRPCDAGEFLPLRARQAAQRYTRLALCLEQAQGPAPFVFRSSQFARSLQKAICLLANLSTLPKYLQSWQ